MPQLVLHTGGNRQLLFALASGLLEQRRTLRREGIGLRFRGWAPPRRQWQRLAKALAGNQQATWLQALRWQRHGPRDTWLCSPGFERGLLKEARFNRWRDWLESHDLQLRVVVHLLPPQQQSWQTCMERILQLKPIKTKSSGPDHPPEQEALYNAYYDGLIETAGVCGVRFVLHHWPAPPHWDQLLESPGGMAATLDQPLWPSRTWGHGPDPRVLALSLAVQQQLRASGTAGTGKRQLRAAIRNAAQSLPELTLADAQQLAREAGWTPPQGAELNADLERFASRVWGRPWPSPAPSQAHDPVEVLQHRQQIAATAQQLLAGFTA